MERWTWYLVILGVGGEDVAWSHICHHVGLSLASRLHGDMQLSQGFAGLGETMMLCYPFAHRMCCSNHVARVLANQVHEKV